MRRTAVMTLVMASFWGAWCRVAPALDEEQQATAVQLMATLARAENMQAAQYLGAMMEDPAHSADDWRRLFEDAYDPAWFTPALAAYWAFALENTADPGRIALISGYCANVSVAVGLSGAPGEAALQPEAPVDIALGWLYRLPSRVDPATLNRVLGHLGEALTRGGAMRLPGPDPTPNLSRSLLQLQLTASVLATGAEGRGLVSRVLQLAGGARTTWERYGILLFDNAGLSEEQVSALHSVLEAMPSGLHRIAAFYVPEATRLDAAAARVTSPGQVVLLPAVPMEVATEPAEFTRDAGQPQAPAFTVTAAQQVIRAVQEVQFGLRPELRTRRDMILTNAGDELGRYLRRTIAPAVYLQNPDELLPSVAFPFAIDASTTFRMAMELFAHRRKDGLDSYLLLLDMLSGGGDLAPLLYTDQAGRLHAVEAPIGRTTVPHVRLPHDQSQRVDMAFVNRLVINEREWLFRFSDYGGVTHWSRVR